MDTLSLYLHIPFCQIRCHYCDFNTVTGQSARQAEYVAALNSEIAAWGEVVRCHAEEFGRPTTPTIFVGGGTPSLLNPDEMASIIETCRSSFAVHADAEVTVEVNPGTANRGHLSGYRSAGVTRLSLGVQTFDNELLASIGRDHDSETARVTVDDAQAAGFDNINVDLMYGLPGQTIAGWRESLEVAATLGVQHISTYAMTIEPATRYGREHAAGRLASIDGDLAADFYELSDEVLESVGFERYEIANFSRPGRECRHNLVYWLNQPFLGLGAGAHSSTVVARFGDRRPLNRYIESTIGWTGPTFASPEIPIADGPIAWVDPLERRLQLAETAMLALRLSAGLNRAEFRRRHGEDAADRWRSHWVELQQFGLVEIDEDHIRLTRRGRLLGDEVFARLLIDS